ncbi:hypothetical protein KBY70_01025 [Cyanobium sp. ATX 6E8]|uniref:hypothetical protein n=1 Tax=Cyanobium sp. ATX 6E8 TaxID=2823701 RepID=UPI0020CFDB04|nr:hypothetical protein [Cyanobium sp. ATX 6E8]MCP9940986.1 hypothetical protein [Cyanobium sp. ATX 6E8]
MSTTTTPTKADELAAVEALAAQLGPSSYLGPWLRDALPWLADQLRCDYTPQRARAMAEEAARVRAEACCDAIAIRQAAQLDARRLLEGTSAQAEQLKAQAEADADRIRGRAWQAIRLAMKELEQ